MTEKNLPNKPCTGFILLDKPQGPTSHDMVHFLRGITKEKKIGHAGTLDPFATGLLLVAVGRDSTKHLSQLVGLSKVYISTFILGAKSTTDDPEGIITPLATTQTIFPQPEEVKQAMKTFLGTQTQIPPRYSAKKIQGKKMYELAREGKEIQSIPHQIFLSQFDLNDYCLEQTVLKISVKINCSSGTYIRALARDLGEKLSLGGYAQMLCRCSIGPFSVQEAISPEKLTPQNWQTFLLTQEKIFQRISQEK